MYATRVEVMVPFGKADAFEERAVRQGDVLQRLDGFRARRVLNALGCPAKYALLTFWESREAARVAVRGAAIRSFLEASPQPDWGTIVRPVEAYDETFTVEGQAQGQTPGQVTLIDWTLTPGQDIAEAFEQSRRNLFELHRLHNPGFLRCRLLRYLGAPGRYLVVVASTGRETMLQAFRHPEIQRYVQDHGIARYAPAAPVVEVFEPVRVAVPA